MLKLALKAFENVLLNAFPEVDKRVYLNWPGPEVKEIYPYLVIFMNRSSFERMEHKYIKTFADGSKLFSMGYFNVEIDVNYLAKDGELSDQADLIDSMSDLFNMDFDLDSYKTTEVSRDIEYQINDYTATANVRIHDIILQQEGLDIQKGDRRSIITLSMYAPRFKIAKPPLLKNYELEVNVSEKILDA